MSTVGRVYESEGRRQELVRKLSENDRILLERHLSSYIVAILSTKIVC